MSNIVDQDGKEIVRVAMPVVEYGEYQLPLRRVMPQDRADMSEKGVRPVDLIREIRATQASVSDNGTLLLVAMIILCNEGVVGLRRFLHSIEAKVKDLNGKPIEVVVDDAHPIESK